MPSGVLPGDVGVAKNKAINQNRTTTLAIRRRIFYQFYPPLSARVALVFLRYVIPATDFTGKIVAAEKPTVAEAAIRCRHSTVMAAVSINRALSVLTPTTSKTTAPARY